MSPDVGGIKRAEAFRESLAQRVGRPLDIAFMEKKRSEGAVSGDGFSGDVQDKTALIIDDLVSSGTTLARAATACRSRGAKAVFAAATHGVFAGDASRVLGDSVLEKMVVTDSIPPFRLAPEVAERKLVVHSVAPLFAEAIGRLHAGGSVEELRGV